MRSLKELVFVFFHWAAVRSQDGRNLPAGDIIHRLIKVAVHHGSVLRFERNVFTLDHFVLRQPRVIQVRHPGEVSAGNGEHLIRAIRRRDGRRKCPVFRERVSVDVQPPTNGSGDLSVGKVHLRQCLRAVIIGEEIDGLPIRRKARLAGHPVKRLSENLCLATTRRRDSDVPGGIVEEFQVSRSGVGEPLPVGRPGRVILLPREIGDLRGVSALVGIVGGHHPDVGIVCSVRIWLRAVAGEGKRLTVGRPRRLRIIVVTRGYLPLRLSRRIEYIEMGAVAINVAYVVVLKLQPVDHPGRLRLGLFPRPILRAFGFSGCRLKLFWRGIAKN